MICVMGLMLFVKTAQKERGEQRLSHRHVTRACGRV
jgi:hypothetical protein